MAEGPQQGTPSQIARISLLGKALAGALDRTIPRQPPQRNGTNTLANLTTAQDHAVPVHVQILLPPHQSAHQALHQLVLIHLRAVPVGGPQE